jgi:predicted site-specific integrase-resolvase
MSTSHLDQKQLAARWGVSTRTLESWRWRGEGPVFLKLGGRVVYRLEDIERYEAERLHTNTVGPIMTGVARHEG